MVNYVNKPGGAAGGDLSGTYPNPAVAQSSAATFTVENALEVQQFSTFFSGLNIFGVLFLYSGINLSGSAPVLTGVAGTNGGGGVQLSDTGRDYMVYLEVGTAGTAMTITMGHTSAASDVTLKASGVATAGDVVSFRLPAGWYFAWSATTATLAQSVAVGC